MVSGPPTPIVLLTALIQVMSGPVTPGHRSSGSAVGSSASVRAHCSLNHLLLYCQLHMGYKVK